MLVTEYRKWLDDCERNAAAKGLTEDEILMVYLERVHRDVVRLLHRKAIEHRP